MSNSVDFYNLRSDCTKVRADDVGFRAERVENLAGSGHEGGETADLQSTNDVPRVRRHETEAADRYAEL